MTSKNIFAKRQRAIQRKLHEWGVDLFVCEDPTDIFYLTGMQLSTGRLFVRKQSVILLVDGRYIQNARKKAYATVKPSSEKLIWKQVKVCAFDTALSYGRVSTIKRELKPIRLKGIESPVLKLRAVKDAHELRLIRKSAELLWKGFLHLRRQLWVGMEERELALEFEFYCREKGAEGVSFPPIIAFGANSAHPHYTPGTRKLKKGDLVLMDLGLIVDGYASDMTRVHFFGEVAPRLKEVYRVVDAAKDAVLQICRPGVSLGELDQAARAVMAKAKLEKRFLHSLGHGIGLNVHEYPSFRDDKQVLKPGMVITIEPGLYLPGKGGVRLEDMVIITKTGHQNLFKKTIP